MSQETKAEIRFGLISEEILFYHERESWHQVLLCHQAAPKEITPVAQIAVAASFAKLARLQAAKQLLASLVEEELRPQTRQLFLVCLGNCLQENGQDGSPCFVEAATFKKFELAPDPDPETLARFSFEPVVLDSAREVALYERSGGSVASGLYGASVERSAQWARRLEGHAKFPAADFVAAVGEFGGWQPVAEMVQSKFRQNREALQKLMHYCFANSAYEMPTKGRTKTDGVVGAALKAVGVGSLAAVQFLCGDFAAAALLARRYLRQVYQARRAAGHVLLKGTATTDVATVVMVGILSMESLPPRKDERALEATNEFLDRLLDSSVLSGPFAYPLQKSQYFLCCGHVLRQLSSRETELLKVTNMAILIEKHAFEPMLEVSRKYILASCCHPHDDPNITAIYDRVLWALFLAGGVHARAVWLFFLARHHAAEAAFYGPVAHRTCCAAALSPWPYHANGPDVLLRMYHFCQMIDSSTRELPAEMGSPANTLLLLCPLVYELEDGTHAYVADLFYPGAISFNCHGDVVQPELRPQIKTAPAVVRGRVHASMELVRLWAHAYCDHHGSVPSWAADPLAWASTALDLVT